MDKLDYFILYIIYSIKRKIVIFLLPIRLGKTSKSLNFVLKIPFYY
nr:MAG TPA: hypothetical protein [Caudoviricetes sp.]